jgi:hypothetical protein
MKPAHILTTEPEAYRDIARELRSAFTSVTVGPEPDRDAKYVLCIAPDALDVVALVRVLRRSGQDTVTTDAGTATYNRPVIPRNFPTLPFPSAPRSAADVWVLMCAYGQAPARVAAITTGLGQLTRLDPRPALVLTEIVFPGEVSAYDALCAELGIQYSALCARERHRVLWQKEACYNRLIQRFLASEATTVITHDPDCYPAAPDWIARVQSARAANPGALFQAWSVYSDTLADTHANVRSYAAAKAAGDTRVRRAPGMAWALSREACLELVASNPDNFPGLGVYNPYFIPGGGDAAFVFDVDSNPQLTRLPFSWSWWIPVHELRECPRFDVLPVDAEMIHVNHGPFPERAYFWRNVALCEWDTVLDAVEYDADVGLVAWRDTQKARQLRHVLANRARMTDQSTMRRLVAEAKRIK